MFETIGFRRNAFSTLLPIVIYLGITIPKVIFRTQIIEFIFTFGGEGLGNILYWLLFASWTTIFLYIAIAGDVLHFFQILGMPKELVKIDSQKLSLEKPVKITEEDTIEEINIVLQPSNKAAWVAKHDIDHDNIWDEEWHERVEIELSDILAVGFHRSNSFDRKRKPGALIIVMKDSAIFVQPMLSDLYDIERVLSNTRFG